MNTAENSNPDTKKRSFETYEQTIIVKEGKDVEKAYKFDTIYKDNTKNKDIQTGDVSEVLYRKNISVFAYGSTGSGKTHTMQGNGTEHGLIQNMSKELFEEMAEWKSL